jgi:hypothetical protein
VELFLWFLRLAEVNFFGTRQTEMAAAHLLAGTVLT